MNEEKNDIAPAEEKELKDNTVQFPQENPVPVQPSEAPVELTLEMLNEGMMELANTLHQLQQFKGITEFLVRQLGSNLGFEIKQERRPDGTFHIGWERKRIVVPGRN